MKITKIKNLKRFEAWKIKDLKVKEDTIEEDIIEEPQFNSGFYRDDDGRLLIVDRNGKCVKLDFDVDKLLEK